MAFFPVLRAASRRALLSSASRSAVCAVGLAGLALTLDAAPATAAHPRHKAMQASRAASKTAKHRKADTSHRAHGRRHIRHEESVEVAEQEPAPIAIPQFALPDLAVAASTYPTGATLAGFGGPTETAMVPASSVPRVLSALTHSATSLLDALVARARSQLGTRYVFGGAEPGAGLDCSSFARYAMEALGIRLPRTANQQAQIGRPIPRDPNLLRPGDLLTFGSRSHVSHVGIYLGEGRFIHASVKHGAIIETTIDRNRSLFRRWQGARRLLAAAGDSAQDQGTTGG
ncbi:hypothetical protein tb265_26830 [Gemmatimonadetes bacterium T265]|nr:hypothetical protein tb265_26830 [Gemmatimonadetes bacterium T265]